MKAIEWFPLWAASREATIQAVGLFAADELDAPVFAAFPSAGDLARHLITTEESWFYGGIQGKPPGAFRPADWDTRTPEQKRAFRRERFPDVPSIRRGLREGFERFRQVLEGRDEQALQEVIRPTWTGGREQPLGRVLWHQMGHEILHRGQIFTRLRAFGHAGSLTPFDAAVPPGVRFPDGATMGDAAPLYEESRLMLRRALGLIPPERFDEVPEALAAALPGAPVGGAGGAGAPAGARAGAPAGAPAGAGAGGDEDVWMSAGDLGRHILASEQAYGFGYLMGEPPSVVIPEEAGGPITRPGVARLAWLRRRLPTKESVLEALETSGERIAAWMRGRPASELYTTRTTHRGEVTAWRITWLLWEHAEHHRGQIHLRMRLMGLTPPGG